MSARVRLTVFGVGAVVLAVLFGLAVAGMPSFGGAWHPYRDIAVATALRQHTPNVVSSVTFDQRGFDTLGEEVILLGSVIGAAALLRPRRREHEPGPDRPREQPPLAAVALLSYLMLPLVLLLGLDLMLHGHLTPGGGFQGGIVLASGLHLSYLAGGQRQLARLRPLSWYLWVEGAATVAFAGIGLAGLATGAGVLANILPHGAFQQLLSAGTVPVLNVVVGFAVGTGAVVLLAQFLTQVAVTAAGPPHRGR